jgi:hypothetical protein
LIPNSKETLHSQRNHKKQPTRKMENLTFQMPQTNSQMRMMILRKTKMKVNRQIGTNKKEER